VKLTLELFRAILESYPIARYVVAYSGGLDSTVLLYLCAYLKNEGIIHDLIAIHINHGLHSEAENWSHHCLNVCESLSIQYQAITVDARTMPGESPEEAARDARYNAFKEILANREVLLTAHHQEDQAETVLLRLFRGAGVQGLAGIAEYTVFGNGQLLRPLLRFDKQSLADFARHENLRWIEDSTNSDPRFDRNFLRQHITPLLKNRWPSIDKTISRTASHCGEAKRHLEHYADNVLDPVYDKIHKTLRIERLKLLCDADKRLVIRQWINRLGYKMPSTMLVQQISTESINAAVDRNPRIYWTDAEINRYRNELYLFPVQKTFDRGQIIAWKGKKILDLPGNLGSLQIFQTKGVGISKKRWDVGEVTIRFRRGGETIRLPYRQGSHSLKNLFQEKSVPPWVRNQMPLIYVDGQLAAVADLWVCEDFVEQHSTDNHSLRWFGYDLGWKSGDSRNDVV